MTTAVGTDTATELTAALREVWNRASRRPSVAAALRDNHWSPEAWTAMADVGLLSAVLRADQGGLGLGRAATGALLVEAGRLGCAGPVIEYVTALPLVRGAAQVDGADLSSVLDDRVVAVVDPVASGSVDDLLVTDGRLSGHAGLVRFGDVANTLVVFVGKGPAAAVVLVDAEAQGVDVSSTVSFDPLVRYADVRFDDVEVLVLAADADALLREVRSALRLAAACEITGAVESLVDQSVAYAKLREQFGRPIGSFQAIQHLLADMAAGATMLGATCRDALTAAEASGSAAPYDLHTKALASRYGREVAEGALQVHGGIGFTVEHPVHRWVQHILGLQGLYGDERSLGRQIGTSLLDGSLTPWT